MCDERLFEGAPRREERGARTLVVTFRGEKQHKKKYARTTLHAFPHTENARHSTHSHIKKMHDTPRIPTRKIKYTSTDIITHAFSRRITCYMHSNSERKTMKSRDYPLAKHSLFRLPSTDCRGLYFRRRTGVLRKGHSRVRRVVNCLATRFSCIHGH